MKTTTGTSSKNYLFISIAQNQSRFFNDVGSVLEQQGCEVAHVCFDEPGFDELESAGKLAFNPYHLADVDSETLNPEDYGIEHLALLLGHEKAAYEKYNTKILLQKFKKNASAMQSVLGKLQDGGSKWIVVQELGGFTPVLAAYFMAHFFKMQNVLIEPSFFKGRVFFTIDSLEAPKIRVNNEAVDPVVEKKINDIVVHQTIAIPEKDKSHFRPAIRKLLDPKNHKMLLLKLWIKYVRGQKREFEHIGGHVLRHVRMSFNSMLNKAVYSALHELDNVIYFPLHVPADFALTVRSNQYLDQCALIETICRQAPLGMPIVIKEHPALIGALSFIRIKQMLARNDNLYLLDPRTNNHEILKKANLTVTVNSKAGAEAVLYGKPVIVLGDAFYKNCPNVEFVSDLNQLGSVILSSLTSVNVPISEVYSFFQSVWKQSFPGELYQRDPKNVEQFAKSLTEAT